MVLGIRVERAGIASAFHNWSVQPSHWSWLRDITFHQADQPHGSKIVSTDCLGKLEPAHGQIVLNAHWYPWVPL